MTKQLPLSANSRFDTVYFSAAMQGGCSIPLGVYAHISGDTINIDAIISDLEGKRYIKRSKTDFLNNAKNCAEKLAQELLTAGGQKILEQIRNT